MTEQGRVWTDVEICCLLAIWNVDAIQNELNGCYRKNLVEQKIAHKLKRDKMAVLTTLQAVLNKDGTSQEVK